MTEKRLKRILIIALFAGAGLITLLVLGGLSQTIASGLFWGLVAIIMLGFAIVRLRVGPARRLK